jgi:hypothetical protein
VLARITKAVPVLYFQKYGCQVHFNTKEFPCEVVKEMSKGTFDKVKVRYGIVEHSNMVSDLHKWDCLLTAGLMQRPYSILIDCESINEAQNANL